MQSLIYPMAALAFLTILMLLLMLFFRVKAVKTRKLSPRYFKLNKGGDVPDHLVAITQNYNNLLELPVLFYVVCLIALVINHEVEYLSVLAWLYVGFRYIHSIIHITYNHILHRFFVYSVSSVLLGVMWVKVVLSVGA